MARNLKQRCFGIVGDCDRHRTRCARRAQGADCERRSTARGDTDYNIIGANRGVCHGLCAGLLVVFGSLSTANESVKSARHGKHDTVGRPIERRRQLATVLHADAPRRAGPGVDDPAAALQRRHGVLDGGRDRGKRTPHRSGRCKLLLEHRCNHLGRRPGIEFNVARIDLLGAHDLSHSVVNTASTSFVPIVGGWTR